MGKKNPKTAAKGKDATNKVSKGRVTKKKATKGTDGASKVPNKGAGKSQPSATADDFAEPEEIMVIVRSLSGRNLTIYIRNDLRWSDLGLEVQKREGIPRERMRLFYGGRQFRGGFDGPVS